MESYLVDPAALGEFVDALIVTKYPNEPVTNHSGLKEDATKALDHQILKTIIGKLTKEQGQELSKLLKDENSTESTFTDFFDKNGIDLEGTIKTTMENFRDEFLGGGSHA